MTSVDTDHMKMNLTGRWAGFLVLLTPALPACTATVAPVHWEEPAAGEAPEIGRRLQTGDVISVTVTGHPDLTVPQATVGASGKMRFSLIGDVHVMNRTVEEVARDIRKKYERDYLRQAPVFVNIVRRAIVKKIRITVLGWVGTPGTYKMKAGTDFLAVLAKAGGLKDEAEKANILIRTRKNPEGYRLDYDEVVSGRVPAPVMQDGDVINVPESFF